eukprot:836672-Rhodomonas_salina.4
MPPLPPPLALAPPEATVTASTRDSRQLTRTVRVRDFARAGGDAEPGGADRQRRVRAAGAAARQA